MADKVTIKAVRLTAIKVDQGVQPRVSGLNGKVVAEYAELAAAGREFPPVVVYDDGKVKWLSEGFHRHAAFDKAGLLEIQAEIRKGTREDAAFNALASNATHGLRRSNDDIQFAVKMALEMRPRWSDRLIADHVGVSSPTVAKYRQTTCKTFTPEPQQREGKDGKTYTVPPKKPKTGQEVTASQTSETESTDTDEPSEPTVIVEESTPAGEPIPDPAEVNKRGSFPFGANAEQPAPGPEAVILPLVVDEWGIPIQPHAVSAFAAVPLFKELLQSIQNTQRLFNKVANHEGGRFLTLPEVSSYRRGKKTGEGEYEDRFVHEGIEAAYRQVKNAIPTHTVCPWHYVDAPHPENCRTCLGLNWTPELSKNIPDEAKQRAQQQFNVSEGDNV